MKQSEEREREREVLIKRRKACSVHTDDKPGGGQESHQTAWLYLPAPPLFYDPASLWTSACFRSALVVVFTEVT